MTEISKDTNEGHANPPDCIPKVYTENEIKLMPNYIDPYKHQKKYINNRRHADPEFRQRLADTAKKRNKERYHTDPEYRARKIQAEVDRKRRKRLEHA